MSVIVAARDAAGTLAAALESLRAQTFTDWETIVVDDGSEDATGAIAASYGASILRNEQPRGPAAARNRGAAIAAGEFLAMLDADDEWMPDFLETQVVRLDAEPAAAMATCDARLRDASGHLLPETWADRVGAPETVTLSTLLLHNTVFTGVLVRRAVFAGLGGYAEDMVHAEDYDLWLRLAGANHEIVVTTRPLAIYRLSANGLSSQPGKLSDGTRDAYDRALLRGGLTRSQRRIARRQRRLHALVAKRARAGPTERFALLPWSFAVALEHPERWHHWFERAK